MNATTYPDGGCMHKRLEPCERCATDHTTETLKAIAQIRDSFPTGSESWWECINWMARALQIEREAREKEQMQ